MWEKLILFFPELLLAFSASQLLLFGVSKKSNRADIVRYIGIAILLVFAFSGFLLGMPNGTAFSGALVIDNYSHYVKLVIGLAGAASLIFAKPYLQSEKFDKHEFTVLLLYAVLGMSIMASANNLLTVYIGVEMQALALYIMAAFNRDSLRSSEAGLKYFVLGALSSGLLLYGLSLVYGFSGSLDFDRIAAVIDDGASPGMIAGMVFMLCGLGFKISAAPFHMWTPDVYEGSNKGLAIVLTMFMFSVMGIPPLLGFWGKLFAFLPAVEAGLVWLVVLALIASVIGAFYYLRIIKSMWFDETAQEFVEAPASLRWTTIICALLVMPLLILPFTAIPATGFISQAAASLF